MSRGQLGVSLIERKEDLGRSDIDENDHGNWRQESSTTKMQRQRFPRIEVNQGPGTDPDGPVVRVGK